MSIATVPSPATYMMLSRFRTASELEYRCWSRVHSLHTRTMIHSMVMFLVESVDCIRRTAFQSDEPYSIVVDISVWWAALASFAQITVHNVDHLGIYQVSTHSYPTVVLGSRRAVELCAILPYSHMRVHQCTGFPFHVSIEVRNPIAEQVCMRYHCTRTATFNNITVCRGCVMLSEDPRCACQCGISVVSQLPLLNCDDRLQSEASRIVSWTGSFNDVSTISNIVDVADESFWQTTTSENIVIRDVSAEHIEWTERHHMQPPHVALNTEPVAPTRLPRTFSFYMHHQRATDPSGMFRSIQSISYDETDSDPATAPHQEVV